MTRKQRTFEGSWASRQAIDFLTNIDSAFRLKSATLRVEPKESNYVRYYKCKVEVQYD